MAASLFKICRMFRTSRPISKDAFMSYCIVNKACGGHTLANVQCSYYHASKLHSKVYKEKQDLGVKETTKGYKPKPKLPPVEVWKGISVLELANNTQRSVQDVLSALKLTDVDTRYRQNSILQDPVVLGETVKKLGYSPRIIVKETSKETKIIDAIKRPPPDPSKLVKRRPVVCVMGHVDHGKTTLLDTLRNTSVVSTEFGGITQHIGAFNVTLNSGENMTFLDTPGHAAFANMRARSSQVTDIIVLVVAADDGVLNQTIECINLAKEENVPVVVAINKIDKYEANIERTQNMLSQHGLQVEAVGGDVQCVAISALKGTNVDTLIETIALQADLMELKGDPTGLVEGTVIESSTDVGRGKLATVLVRRGTLRKGSIIVSGLTWAKVRNMFDHTGKIVQEARLSDAVQVIGWKSLPVSGDEVLEVESADKAQEIIRYRKKEVIEEKMKEQDAAAKEKLEKHLVVYKKMLEQKRKGIPRNQMKVPEIPEETETNHVPELNVIIKGDVHGTVEAILDVLETYDKNEQCKLNIVHYGVGDVTQTDIELAKTFNAIIYAFHTEIPSQLKDTVKTSRVKVHLHKVIYKLVDDVIEQINEILPTCEVEEELGQADILQEFIITEKNKKLRVAGCRCIKGVLQKSEYYHVKRGDEIIYTGKLASMRHLKNEVTSIKAGVDCGVILDDPEADFKPGDVLICFNKREAKRTIDWIPDF